MRGPATSGRAATQTTDNATVSQGQYLIQVPFTQCSVNYTWDIQDILANRGEEAFINLIRSRKIRAMWSAANGIELGGWSAPQSAQDALRPLGVPYWLSFAPAGTVAGTYGFNGNTVRYANGTTSSVIGGLDAVAYPKWASFTGVYNAINNSLLTLLHTAIRQTRFEPPAFIDAPGDDNWADSQAAFYSSNDVIAGLINLGDMRDDDNAPKDLAGKLLYSPEGTVFFNRMPFIYTKPLDAQQVTNSQAKVVNPGAIYCIDWSKLQCVAREGLWQVDSHPIVDKGQHTVFSVFTDWSFQILGINRRSLGFCLHLPI